MRLGFRNTNGPNLTSPKAVGLGFFFFPSPFSDSELLRQPQDEQVECEARSWQRFASICLVKIINKKNKKRNVEMRGLERGQKKDLIISNITIN